MRKSLHARFLALLIGLATCGLGCIGQAVSTISDFVQDGDRRNGITYYVGGAGPAGHVGSLDIPSGLRDAGYTGYVRVYTWQGITHAGDQISLEKNREKAADLAYEIRVYARQFPGKKINIVALSAGTGIATFALEYLPERIQVENVVFLGSSLSSHYDLSKALRRVRGRLYCVYSPSDFILRDIVRYTGTVDRRDAADGLAGLQGFRRPLRKSADTERQYAKLRNVPYREEFASVGYFGQHMDSTSRAFVREYLAGVLLNTDTRLLGQSGRAGVASADSGSPDTPDSGRLVNEPGTVANDDPKPRKSPRIFDDEAAPPSRTRNTQRRAIREPTSRPSHYGMP